MILRLVLGFLISAFAVTVGIVSSGGDPLFLLNAQSFILGLGLPVFAALAAYGPGVLGRSIRSALSPAETVEDEAGLRAAKAVLGGIELFMAVAALVGFFFGFIWMLKYLADKSLIARNFALSLVAAFWDLFFVIALVEPMRASVQRKLVSIAKEPVDEGGTLPARGAGKPSGRWLGIGSLLILLSVVFTSYIGYGDPPYLLIDLPSMALMLFLPLGAVFAGPGLPRLFASMGSALGAKGADHGPGALRRAASDMAFLTRTVLLSSAMGGFLGALFMLVDIFNKQRVGPCVALSLISVMLGLVFCLAVSMPLQAAANRRLILAEGNRAE
jgi:flagellar motor component MotA